MAQQRYHVIERIDAGGMAEVFKANSTSLQGFEKLVAIKRILPKLAKNERFVRMFLDEAKLSLHLSHTNCVQVFDLGLADGTYFIVMEFVDGVNLKHVIEESRANNQEFPIQQAVYVGLEICKGLDHAHRKTDQQGNHLAIVHRDISPPNILISREGEVKITDFGLAKAKSQVETTDPGVVKGKFGYLSPEAAHGEHVDARTDIFAIGILIWEMLTGTRLFLGETDLETLQQVRKNNVPSLAKYRDDVPHDLERIVRRALASSVNDRYPNVREFGRDLANFLFAHGEPVTAFDISHWVAAVRSRRPQAAKGERDKAVEEAVQQAVNNIITLEEVDDLDRFMAETYASLPDQGADLDIAPSGEVHDPRMWADMGFGDMELAIGEPDNSDAWEERNVTELRSRPSAPEEAVPVPDLDLHDERTVELNDMDGALRADAMRVAQQMNLERHSPGLQNSVDQQGEGFGQQSIQPVSDSVSQAMAQVQKRAQQSDEPGVGSHPNEPQQPQQQGQQNQPKGPSNRGGGATTTIAIVLFVFVLVAALVAGVVFGGIL